MKNRKFSFPTVIPFTQARLQAEADRVRSLGLGQVQYTCENFSGFQAVIYGSGRITLYSRCMFQRNPVKVCLGELGLITLAQARQQHQANRAMAAQGTNPKQPAKKEMLYRELHEDHYLVQCRSRGKKSIHTDISRQNTWIGPALNGLAVTAINKSHIHNLLVAMIDAGLAPATIRTTIGQVRTTLELAVDLEIITRNPTKGVRAPRVDNRREIFLTAEQVRAFCEAARHDANTPGATMLVLMALTGARLGEAIHARWEDIDLESGIWHLPDQKSGRRGRIYLSEAAKTEISRMADLRCNEFVFPGRAGKGHLGRPIRLFKRLCQAANIPAGFRIHDLRHAWVSAGVNAGIPLEIMSQGARHASVAVTRLYSHAQDTNLSAANETIANLFMPKQAA